jgi:hypothetical protein
MNEHELRESMNGRTIEATFAEAMPRAMAEMPESAYTRSSIRDQLKQQLAERHGLDLHHRALPSGILEMSEEQLTGITQASDPFLTAWSTSTVHAAETSTWRSGDYSPEDHLPAHERQVQQALLESLPVLHALSLPALEGAIQTGRFLSNREVYDQTDIPTLQLGATNVIDRALGLDRYVFGDFGRLNSQRNTANADAIVVFEPSVMRAPGTFLTEHDIQDIDITLGGKVDPERYMSGALLAEDMYKAIPLRLKRMDSTDGYSDGRHGMRYPRHTFNGFMQGHDANPTNISPASFSTWEVKIPEGDNVTTDHIRKVLFTNEDKYHAFVEKHGDAAPVELVRPQDIAAGRDHQGGRLVITDDGEYVKESYPDMQAIFGTYEAAKKRLAEIREQDYEHRKKIVAAAGDTAMRGYMLIQDTDTLSFPPEVQQADPTMYARVGKIFDSLDELKDGVYTLDAGTQSSLGMFKLETALPEVRNIYDNYDDWDCEIEKPEGGTVELIDTQPLRVVRVAATEAAAVVTDATVDFDTAQLDVTAKLYERLHEQNSTY